MIPYNIFLHYEDNKRTLIKTKVETPCKEIIEICLIRDHYFIYEKQGISQ